MFDFKSTLQQTADFLRLTLDHEWAIPSFDFALNTQTGLKINVSVIDTGIILFEPEPCLLKASANTKNIVLSCGIHGNETAPIEICAGLIKQLLLGKIALAHRVLFIIGNPPAINQNKRFVDQNLNSLFSNVDNNNQCIDTFEQQRATLLENVVRAFYQPSAATGQRYHFDLHTAIRDSLHEKFAIYPFLHGQPWDKNLLSLLKLSGVNTVLFANAPTTTFSYFSSQHCNAKSLTIELGKVYAFGKNQMANFKAMINSLTALLTKAELALPPFEYADFKLYEIHQRIDKRSANLLFNFPETTANFTAFAQGELIAKDGELSYYCQYDGEAILFPNAKVPVGQRALLTVKPYIPQFI